MRAAGLLIAAVAAGALLTECSRGQRPASVVTTGDGSGTDPTRAVALSACARSDLKPVISGGGPALGYVAVVIRFTNVGAPCLLGGWPQMTAIRGRVHAEVTRRVRSAPALVGGKIRGKESLSLQTGDAAYLVIDGSDEPRGASCNPPYRQFVVRLPGVPAAFRLAARIPNGSDYFPACVPLGASRLVATANVIPKLR